MDQGGHPQKTLQTLLSRNSIVPLVFFGPRQIAEYDQFYRLHLLLRYSSTGTVNLFIQERFSGFPFWKFLGASPRFGMCTNTVYKALQSSDASSWTNCAHRWGFCTKGTFVATEEPQGSVVLTLYVHLQWSSYTCVYWYPLYIYSGTRCGRSHIAILLYMM